MSIITRYLLTRLAFTLILLWMALVALVALFDVLAGINDLRTDYGTVDMLYHVWMLLPQRFYDLLPAAGLLATLVVMGSLANQGALTIFQTSGISRIGLISYFAVPLVLLSCLLVMLLDQWILDLHKQAIDTRSVKLGRANIHVSKPYWHKQDHWMVHAMRLDAQNRVHALSIYETNNAVDTGQAMFTRYLHADFADFVAPGSPWQLHRVHEYRLIDSVGTEDSNKIKAPHAIDYTWHPVLSFPLNITPELIRLATRAPEFLRLHDLFRYKTYLARQGFAAHANVYAVTFWSRIFAPFTMLALIYLAAAFIFGPLRTASAGQRVMTGFLVGLIFNSIQNVTSAASVVFSWNPVLAATVPSMLLLCGAYFLQRRIG